MSALAKSLILLLKDKRFWKAVTAVLLSIVILLVMAWTNIQLTMQGAGSALADQAEAEYRFWENTTPAQAGFSCQGEKYCSHFNYSVVDWCCIFIGYCADEAGVDKEEIGFSINTGVWKQNLIDMDKYRDPDTYQPRRGNVVLFDYSGRAHHDATGDTQHIGLVVGVSDDGSSITVIAGNEDGDGAGIWCCNSKVTRYELSATDNNIACYGAVGADASVTASSLNMLVRDVITHNEIGAIYSELSGQYGSVIPCDVNAISIGVYGWHGNGALELLQRAYSINPREVHAVCNSYGSTGAGIENAIVSGSNWSVYIPSTQQANCIKAILLTNSGKQAQDETSLEDAQYYIDICNENGLTDYKCIAYCCDILNQWGIYSFEGGCLDGVTGNMSLSQIYNSRRAWADSNYNYYNRRTWTYNYVKDFVLQPELTLDDLVA